MNMMMCMDRMMCCCEHPVFHVPCLCLIRYKTDLTPEKDALDVITRRAVGGEDIDRVLLLNSVEGLFRV